MKRAWFALVCVFVLGCGVEDGSLENGEDCDDSVECKSGYCRVSADTPHPVCADRCIKNGNACGPVGQAAGCCSGKCGGNGTCEL